VTKKRGARGDKKKGLEETKREDQGDKKGKVFGATKGAFGTIK
jgi:hypothetical protein